MPRLRNIVTFQGLPCKRVKWSISEGLNPDRGWVDIDYVHLVKAKTVPRQTLIRGHTGFSVHVPISPNAFDAIRSTTSPVPAITAPGGGGLEPYGDLVLETQGGQPRLPLTYKDVYLDPGGMVETMEMLKHAEGNRRGTVRVFLTDVRAFYGRKNPCYCLMNVKYPTGTWDYRSLDKDGNRHTMEKAIKFLFSQLPGSPAVFAIDPDLPEPGAIIGRGELTVHVLQRTLDENRLAPLKQPDNNYVVRRRGAPIEVRQIATAPNVFRTIGADDELAGDLASAYYNYRPMLVMVQGDRRLARITCAMVAVVKNERGRWELLTAFVARIGYSMASLNTQVLLKGKAFYDLLTADLSGPGGVSGAAQSELAQQAQAEGGTFQVGFGFGSGGGPGAGPSGGIIQPSSSAPQPGEFLTGDQAATGSTGNFTTAGGRDGGAVIGGVSSQARATYAEILRAHAYRSYAPAFLFAAPEVTEAQLEEAGVPRGAQAEIEGPSELDDDHFLDCNFLPVLDPAFYDAELDALRDEGLKFPSDADRHEGDDGPWRVVKPIVWAARVGETHAVNFKDCKDRFAEMELAAQLRASELAKQIALVAQELENGQILARPHDLRNRLRVGKLDPIDYQRLGLEPGASDPDVNDRIREQEAAAVRWRRELELKRQKLQQQHAEALAAITENRRFFERLERAYTNVAAAHGLDLIINIPFGIQNRRSIDPKTGVVTFAEPMCMMREGMVLNRDNATVIADGGVLMTWGYERKAGNVTDYTTVVIGAEDKEDPEVFSVAISTPLPVAMDAEQLPGMRLYEDELGKPLNLKAVQEQAKAKAVAQFKQPRAVEGYEYKLGCFTQVVLEAGIQSIQHEWDGTKRENARSRTIIMANSPGAAGPMGLGRMRRGDSYLAITRDMLERGGTY